jgi:hypothetical protein
MSKVDGIVMNVDSDGVQFIDVCNMHDKRMVLWSAFDRKYFGDGDFVVDRRAKTVNSFCWDGNQTTIGKNLDGKTQC